jgi:hypothetical protein
MNLASVFRPDHGPWCEGQGRGGKEGGPGPDKDVYPSGHVQHTEDHV